MRCWVRTPPRRPLPLQQEPPPPPPSPEEAPPLLPLPPPRPRRRPQLQPRRGRLRQRQLRRYPRELQVGALGHLGGGAGRKPKTLELRSWVAPSPLLPIVHSPLSSLPVRVP